MKDLIIMFMLKTKKYSGTSNFFKNILKDKSLVQKFYEGTWGNETRLKLESLKQIAILSNLLQSTCHQGQFSKKMMINSLKILANSRRDPNIFTLSIAKSITSNVIQHTSLIRIINVTDSENILRNIIDSKCNQTMVEAATINLIKLQLLATKDSFIHLFAGANLFKFDSLHSFILLTDFMNKLGDDRIKLKEKVEKLFAIFYEKYISPNELSNSRYDSLTQMQINIIFRMFTNIGINCLEAVILNY
ncbi:MAG: hypothetical protein MHMPM18_000408 [Marteilia pararefringens]